MSKLIQQMFLEAIQSNYEKIAIETASKDLITYKELYKRAGKLANYLMKQGLMPGKGIPVAILMEQGAQYVEAMVTCLLFGYSAVLLSKQYPKERCDYVISDSGARFLLEEKNLHEAYQNDKVCEDIELDAETAAIMIYTSGSTGKPKGVLHTQQSVGAGVGRLMSVMRLTPEDRYGASAPFTFVVHGMEIFSPLCSGSTLVLIPPSMAKDPAALSDFHKERNITATHISPKVLKLYEKKADSLKLVLTGSEKICNLAPHGYRLVGIYGQSETYPGVFAFDIEHSYDVTPLGKPSAGIAAYLIDDNGNEADEGELCLAGNFFKEYINMPEQTAKTLTKNPFAEKDGFPLLHHTGDLAKRLDDGNYMYLNRRDWMIKINGQRVEPGEIEICIKRMNGILDAVVKDFVNPNGQVYMCAYYVTVKGASVSGSEIRDHLMEKLPLYMIPAFFTQLEALPVNQNGKLDRFALREPEINQTMENVMPNNPTEKQALEIARSILPNVEFGVTDDLRLAGLDSISTIMLVQRLTSEMHLKVRVSELLRYHNIRDLLSHKRRISWFYKDYDPSKPVVVLPHGVVFISYLENFCEVFSKYYNVFIIEPVTSHYEKLLRGETFNDVVELYLMQVDLMLPKEAKIAGFAGFCFGGMLALGMARRLEKTTGKAYPIIIGDSVFGGIPSNEGQLVVTPENLWNYLFEPVDVQATYDLEKRETLAHAVNVAMNIGTDEITGKYNGKIIYLNALAGAPDAAIQHKLAMLKTVSDSPEVIDFKNKGHLGLIKDSDMREVWEEIVKKL